MRLIKKADDKTTTESLVEDMSKCIQDLEHVFPAARQITNS